MGFLSRTPNLREGTGIGELVGRLSKMEGLWVIGRGSCLPCLVHPLDIQRKSSGTGMERQLETTLKQEDQRI